MKKLALALDDLDVVSFATDDGAAPIRGTLVAHEDADLSGVGCLTDYQMCGDLTWGCTVAVVCETYDVTGC